MRPPGVKRWAIWPEENEVSSGEIGGEALNDGDTAVMRPELLVEDVV